MTTLKSLFAAVLVVTLSGGVAFAQVKVSETETTKLFIILNTVGTAQALSQENVYGANGQPVADLEPGLQTAFGNLGFVGKFGKNDEIEMYFDLYLASRNHPSTTYGNQGYLIIRDIPENLGQPRLLKQLFKHVDVKAGAFLLDYGDHLAHRSNNAIVQPNPLVGNFVIDPELVTVGMEVISKPSAINWLIGLSNGTNTEDFQDGRGIAFNAKVWGNPIAPLRTSVSFFRVDHAESGTSRATLYSGNRGGERYGAILGGGQAPGQLLPAAGKDLTAGQLDLTWDNGKPLKLYGHVGMTSDRDTNGSLPGQPEESWNYYAGDVVYQFTPAIYGAARYSAADARKINDLDSNATVDRIQVGGGIWLSKSLLLKLEYVAQKYRRFAEGNMVNNGIQAWRNPEFSGLVSEVSFSF